MTEVTLPLSNNELLREYVFWRAECDRTAADRAEHLYCLTMWLAIVREMVKRGLLR